MPNDEVVVEQHADEGTVLIPRLLFCLYASRQVLVCMNTLIAMIMIQEHVLGLFHTCAVM